MQGGSGSGALDRHRIVGPGSAALKYDVLTALLVLAAQGDPVEARLAMRLSLVMTARFNWRTGTFTVGLRELARMWGVTDRTAKREMAAMRARDWIALHSPATRGRVASYSITLPKVLRATMPFWDAVGPDFAARMVGAPQPETTDNVIPLRSPDPQLPEPDPHGWAEAAAMLSAQDPSVYNAWFSGLRVLELESGVLSLGAPSRFHADYVRTHYRARVLAAVVSVNRGVREILVEALD
ncbi:MAG: DnaA N-terminal domain-containing protein [Paracoccaceae bacterium]